MAYSINIKHALTTYGNITRSIREKKTIKHNSENTIIVDSEKTGEINSPVSLFYFFFFTFFSSAKNCLSLTISTFRGFKLSGTTCSR